MIKKPLFQAIRILLIIATLPHTHAHAKGTKEIDAMDMPGVFSKINMSKVAKFEATLKKYQDLKQRL